MYKRQILFKAHQDLEKLVLDRDTMNFKNQVSLKYAQLVYDGLWFTPLKDALDAFVDSTQDVVTGVVKMKLYKGNAIPVASKSKYSLFNEGFATFGEDDVYNLSLIHISPRLPKKTCLPVIRMN